MLDSIDSLSSNLIFLFRKKFKNVKIPQLRPATAHGLLKHAVIILLAHIGYETASDYAIGTLTDVADYFLKRIALLLKVASEERNCGFQVSYLIKHNAMFILN